MLLICFIVVVVVVGVAVQIKNDDLLTMTAYSAAVQNTYHIHLIRETNSWLCLDLNSLRYDVY